MREGWVEVELGEVLSQVQRPVATSGQSTIPFAGVRWYAEGVYRRDELDASEVKTKSLNRLEESDITYNRMWATKAAFGVVGVEVEGCLVTNDFPIFEANEDRLLPGFFELITKTTGFQSDASLLATGTTERRRLKERDFIRIRVLLPPLAEQRRIVDLIGAVDDALVSADEEAQRASNARQSAEVAHFNEGGEALLTDVTDFAGGYAFSERFQGGTGPIPVYKCSDMNTPGNEMEMSQAANSVTEETLKEMKARAWPPGTVIFPKVGAALLTEKRRILRSRAAFDNNVMGLIPNPSIRPEYLLSFMRTVRLGDYAQPGAVPSVNQKHFQQMTLNLPSLEDQDEFLGLIGALTQVEVSASEVAGCLREARSALLAELLSGDFEIPDSYDSFLEVAS